MNFLPFAHGVCMLGLGMQCAEPLLTLLYPCVPIGIPHEQERKELHRVSAVARQSMKRSLCVYLLVLGYCHVYQDSRNVLISRRESALLQPIPYSCQPPSERRTPSLLQSLRTQFMPETEESLCASYIERIHINTWPNPLYVLVDVLLGLPGYVVTSIAAGVGSALSHFLNHFSFLMQLSFLVLAPACFYFLHPLYAPTHPPLHWHAALVNRRLLLQDACWQEENGSN